jgi:hypothetical protein
MKWLEMGGVLNVSTIDPIVLQCPFLGEGRKVERYILKKSCCCAIHKEWYGTKLLDSSHRQAVKIPLKKN